jgi:hypothetical protein
LLDIALELRTTLRRRPSIADLATAAVASRLVVYGPVEGRLSAAVVEREP